MMWRNEAQGTRFGLGEDAAFFSSRANESLQPTKRRDYLRWRTHRVRRFAAELGVRQQQHSVERDVTFFWLLGMTAQLIWPFYLASGVVLAIAWHRRRAGHALDRQPLWHLVILLSTPLLLTLWASLTFGAERHARPGEWGWASALLTLLAVSIVCGAGWMLRRWRRQWLVAAPCVLAVVLATAMAWFIGAMAIADDWL